jgi:hypothetical protein
LNEGFVALSSNPALISLPKVSQPWLASDASLKLFQYVSGADANN